MKTPDCAVPTINLDIGKTLPDLFNLNRSKWNSLVGRNFALAYQAYFD